MLPIATKNKMADGSRCSSVTSETFELPATTWTVIQSCCPQREANEVKRVVGDSLIEEACDLHTEVSNHKISGYFLIW